MRRPRLCLLLLGAKVLALTAAAAAEDATGAAGTAAAIPVAAVDGPVPAAFVAAPASRTRRRRMTSSSSRRPRLLPSFAAGSIPVSFFDVASSSSSSSSFSLARRRRGRHSLRHGTPLLLYSANDDDDEEEDKDQRAVDPEVLFSDGDFEEGDDDDDDVDWLPDREKARRRKGRVAERQIDPYGVVDVDDGDDARTPIDVAVERRQPQQPHESKENAVPSPYTDEEEQVIKAMGGKTRRRRLDGRQTAQGSNRNSNNNNKREDGYLGDSTLEEICTDYSVPISYLADVMCDWGVPVPIDPRDRLGDMVTGEQAFAVLEAVNSLDIGQVQDLYSGTSMRQLCVEWDIALPKAFEMAMREGWNLPFGVNTCLRQTQEDELVRVLGSDEYMVTSMADDDDDDGY